MANINGGNITKKLESKHVTTLRDWFNQDDFQKKIIRALPKVINHEAFITNAYNIYANNTKLQECSLASFLNALMQAAKVGLMPNTPLGHCYIIPYKREATFQMGYPGHIELALRTNKYKTIYAHEVYPKDYFKWSLGMKKDLEHIPSNELDRKKDKPIYYYAAYKLINGGENFECWSMADILEHRDKFSSGYRVAKQYNKETVWETDFDSMALKTMVVRVLKMAPKSTEMVYALSTEPGEEGRKNMFPEDELDITPPVEDLPADKPENEEEKEEDISSVEGEPVNLGELEEIAKAAGYDNWKAIIIEGCKLKNDKGKAIFSADIDEDGAKDLLQNDKNRFSVLYEHFNIMIDQEQVKAGKG
jgi:recombination protein RecT